MPKDVDDLKGSEISRALGPLKPLASLAFYLFLLGFALFRILESFTDGYLRAPKFNGTASPGEPGYWFFLAIYGAMILVGIFGLVGMSRRKKSSTPTRMTRDLE